MNMDDEIVLGDVNRAFVRLFFAIDDPEQSGFAMAVSSNQSQTFTAVQLESDVVEQDMITKSFRQVFDTDHLRALYEIKDNLKG